MAHSEFGFLRLCCASPRVQVADPTANVDEMLIQLKELESADIILYPELCISSYSCGRLFLQSTLLDGCEAAVQRLAEQSRRHDALLVVGAPLRYGHALYNCAIAMQRGKLKGIVPKQYLPDYNEFYEARWFTSALDFDNGNIHYADQDVPIGTNLLFETELAGETVSVFIEICEDLWMPIPPSSVASLEGANVILNLSSSPETIGKAHFRRTLVSAQSGRCISAYAYASSAPTESTAEVVFGGHCLIAERGHIHADSGHVGDGSPLSFSSQAILADIDLQRIQLERRNTTTFRRPPGTCVGSEIWRRVPFTLSHTDTNTLLMPLPALPFVPRGPELDARCEEILGIQCAALAKRLEMIGDGTPLSIGVSGGLDSTLAFLVAVRTLEQLGLPLDRIHAMTLPGFGTTSRTLENARTMLEGFGTRAIEIDIRKNCLEQMQALAEAVGYRAFSTLDPRDFSSEVAFSEALRTIDTSRGDLRFENIQARHRTSLLMNTGFVLGTGDMSESWLGWCTYNADQQSMYNVNASVPKTLVKSLVKHVARHSEDSERTRLLNDIASTMISPELLPVNGDTPQSTEDSVGPYELHDFFLYHLVRNGANPAKLLHLASQARGFSREYSSEELRHWLGLHLSRAITQQYKRDTMPNGPKVGTVSLSPRGDWRMPSDASAAVFLDAIDRSDLP